MRKTKARGRRFFTGFFALLVLASGFPVSALKHTEEIQVTQQNQRKLQKSANSTNTKGVGVSFQEQFPDQNLAKAVATKFKKQIGDQITQNDIDNLTQLVLNGKKITNLQGIELFSNLTELQIGENNFAEFPTEIYSLTNLTDLFVYYNGFTHIPEGIETLKNLETFNGAGNQFTSLPEGFYQLSQLRGLYLDNNNFSILSQNIANLTNLEALEITRNQLTSLPSNIGELSNLRELYLSANRLVSLPDSVTDLTNLECLYVDSNRLTSLPKDLGNLTGIIDLTASDNQLTSLPDSIGALYNLSTVQLNNNRLTALPTELYWPNLINFYCTNNQLTEFPSGLTHSLYLFSLDLSENKLTDLPDYLGNLSQLNLLNISANKIGKLPDSIVNLSLVESFYMNSNQIRKLTEEQYSFIGNIWEAHTEQQQVSVTLSDIGTVGEAYHIPHFEIKGVPSFTAQLTSPNGTSSPIEPIFENGEIVVIGEHLLQKGEYELSLSTPATGFMANSVYKFKFTIEPLRVSAVVTANYQTEDGFVLHTETVNGFVGDAYTVPSYEFKGYTLAVAPESQTGVFTKEPITITFIYEKSGAGETPKPNPTPTPAPGNSGGDNQNSNGNSGGFVEETTSVTGEDTVIHTGDRTKLILFGTLLIASFLICIFVLMKKKKIVNK